ncbi:hypothetical protein H6G41_13130 [Tolypothrix sp. FACHB-123]|uniref:hypothetical protein n=1 Tax=Tolypothrix sp. FACHB-123 TaxID=2692868 RepID=UPI001684A125|nr:hypothetical protein [Tolypothrix sp. FACHB-123]MBD2355546.1 hypothetical protein [Tolypothrix sp. FACHB-123]
MKEVLDLIQKRKEEFAKLRLFEYLKDESIDPLERVAWAPCFAPFAMNFKDLNAYALRQEPTTDPIQEMINTHTYEDGQHWAWYLTDIERLNIDLSMRFTETLRFLWGDETKRTRHLCYDLFALSLSQTDPLLKLAIIESIEVTGTVALSALAKLGNDLEQLTKKHYRYLSAYHLGVETGHVQGGQSYEDTDNFLKNIQLTEQQTSKALEIVNRVFDSFTDCVKELMDYADNHSFAQPFPKIHKSEALLQTTI